ncbi:type II secretion system protein GspH [Moritella marina ATCC 15381]|uniref:Type II secretion system protein H n=1 Tax=Moritella marina ATCC 15381 TaxID=1202962 RepID=A0A5J6WSA7_MORMI|nr:type II secretion system minor pseudopilin GspH [Moritella marina]QFI39282.1 type II secretion system protein GspH [Moritella marina ATCC 15381]
MNTRTHQEAGFTLLEIMLVIFLMGMMITGVVMTMSSAGPDRQLKQAAARFIGVLELAEEEALLSSMEMGLVIEAQQYQFVYLDDNDRWSALDDSKFFAKQALKEDIQLSLELAGLKAEGGFLGSRKLFADDDGLFEDDDGLFEGGDKKDRIEPDIYIYSSGEITDFTLTFTYMDVDLGDSLVKVQFDEYGDLMINSTADEF